MAGKVKTARRAYHSPLRADQAQQTRRRVLESARRLFVEHGYARTTVAAVADHAGVSPETIYLSLGGKRGLLEGVMDITGPHDSVADDDQWWEMVAQLPDAAERLAKMVEYSCRILARTRPIHAIIRGAADNEAFAAELGRRLLDERLTNQTERIRTLPRRRAHARTVGRRGGPALLRPHQPRALPPAHRRARLDRRAAPELAHPAPPYRTPRAHRPNRAVVRATIRVLADDDAAGRTELRDRTTLRVRLARPERHEGVRGKPWCGRRRAGRGHRHRRSRGGGMGPALPIMGRRNWSDLHDHVYLIGGSAQWLGRP